MMCCEHGCSVKVVKDASGELIDEDTGFPHRLTCPKLSLEDQLHGVGRGDRVRRTFSPRWCPNCAFVSRFSVVWDAGGRLVGCSSCGETEYIAAVPLEV